MRSDGTEPDWASPSPWHRRVSPIFFALLLVAGLMIGVVGYAGLMAVIGTLGR